MTNDIIKLMYERDHVHARATQSNDSKSWQDYHNLRNKVTCIIKKRINSCFNCIHTLYRNNPKTMWLEIKQPVPGKNKHSHITCDISVNDFNQHLPILASKWTQNLDTFFSGKAQKVFIIVVSRGCLIMILKHIWDLYLLNPIMIYWVWTWFYWKNQLHIFLYHWQMW